jgi:GT2 family glycosyltransferase
MRAYVEWQNALLDHDAIFRDRFVESPLVHPSVTMRAEALRRLGSWRAFDGPEDYDLWLRAFDAGLRFAKLPETLLVWRDGKARLTRVDRRYAPARFLALKLEALARGPLAGSRAVVVWGAGRVGKAWSRALRARGHALAAFVEVDPRKIGQRVHGAPVVSVADGARLRGPLHLAAVGQKGARGRIRAEALRLGLEEGRDLVAVA